MSADTANFLNLHVLISHSPSCLNRDDMNMQKSAVFGGKRRSRISSQCLKRAMRTSAAYQSALGAPSIRTRELRMLIDRFAAELADSYDRDLVTQAVGLIAGEKKLNGPVKEVAIAPWSVAEVAEICARLKAVQGDEKATEKLAKELSKAQEHDDISLRAAIANAVDIALFGRMTTSGVMAPVDGAMAVAHAITTHTVEADIDWFTAVDDLISDEGETGAGHLNVQEFGAGVFYRYASLNLRQLQENMGSVERDKALDVAGHLVHLLATVVPEAKQNSFAAHNPADMVWVEFGNLPLSAANAFETPVKRDTAGGFRLPSIAALADYIDRVRKGYGIDGAAAGFCLEECDLDPCFETLAELQSWVREGGK